MSETEPTYLLEASDHMSSNFFWCRVLFNFLRGRSPPALAPLLPPALDIAEETVSKKSPIWQPTRDRAEPLGAWKMGNANSGPEKCVLDKFSDSGASAVNGLIFGTSSMQGWRPSQEDDHLIDLDLDGRGTALIAVFDGHGGGEVSKFVAKRLARECRAMGARSDTLGALFLRMDELMRSPKGLL